jgi:predicted transcriptional regulator
MVESSMNRRRSNIEIIAEMLKVGENGAGKTELMYSVNMSYAQLQKYLKFLLTHGLVQKVELGNPCVRYHVTDKGAELMKSIDAVLEVLDIEE